MPSGREGLEEVPQPELVWALGSICALHRVPFEADLVARDFPPPCTRATLIAAARALGLRIEQVKLKPRALPRMSFPLLVALKHDARPDARPRHRRE